MLKIARRSGLEHCAAKKAVAACESSLVENDPGMTKTSNWGALANEFCSQVSSRVLEAFNIWNNDRN